MTEEVEQSLFSGAHGFSFCAKAFDESQKIKIGIINYIDTLGVRN